MNDPIEYFMFPEENLKVVLTAFFSECVKADILPLVPMEEIVQSFNKQYPVDDGHYELSEPEMIKFIDDMCGIYVDRLMVDMDKRGLATLAHNGEEFCLVKNK